MPVKRLRSGKTINSDLMADLSFSVKEQIYTAVRKQFAETAKLPAEYDEESEKINKMGFRILKIEHDVNEYCQAISGRTSLKTEQTEICEAISEIYEKSVKFIDEQKISFIKKIPKENIFVKIDRERFYYSVLNLFLNAVENTPEGGRIRVSVSKTKKFVKITVGDNGFGMDEDSLEHCFEPFYTKNHYSGRKKIGLGLTLAHHFAVESGGRMNIISEKEKGTAVSILIPLMDENEINFSFGTFSPEIPGEKLSPVNIVFSVLE